MSKQKELRNNILATRFSDKDHHLILRICRARQEPVADFIRIAVLQKLAELSYLDNTRKKALGIKN